MKNDDLDNQEGKSAEATGNRSVQAAFWNNKEKKYIFHDSAEFEGTPLHEMLRLSGSLNKDANEIPPEGETDSAPPSSMVVRVAVHVSIANEIEEDAEIHARSFFDAVLLDLYSRSEIESECIGESNYRFRVVATKSFDLQEPEDEWVGPLSPLELAASVLGSIGYRALRFEYKENLTYELELLGDPEDKDVLFEHWDEEVRCVARDYIERHLMLHVPPAVIGISEQVMNEWASRVDRFPGIRVQYSPTRITEYRPVDSNFRFVVVYRPYQKEPIVISAIE